MPLFSTNLRAVEKARMGLGGIKSRLETSFSPRSPSPSLPFFREIAKNNGEKEGKSFRNPLLRTA
jgi:hypothetical protein